MTITSELNATTKKLATAWFTLEGTAQEESKADEFLKAQGVDLQETEIDRIDNEIYISFPWEVTTTKAKELSYLRKQLRGAA